MLMGFACFDEFLLLLPWTYIVYQYWSICMSMAAASVSLFGLLETERSDDLIDLRGVFLAQWQSSGAV